MLRPRLLLPCLALLATLGCTPAIAHAQTTADGLKPGAEYFTGQSGRFLMGGTWLRRLDPQDQGAREGWARQTDEAGWTRTAVPNAWNATDRSAESFAGGIGWYRKDFKLPAAAKRLAWIVRFESVNYRSRIYLNGQLIGKNTGAYLPFEVRLPSGLLRRGETNRLVIRIDSRRFPTDFPPSGLSTTGTPTGGWWNYGGILREVYLRKVDGVDFSSVLVRPNLPCATCTATVAYSATLRNYSDKPLRVKVTGRLGARKIDLGTLAIGAKRFGTFSRTVAVKRPKIWSPTSPYLYDASLRARSGDRQLQAYSVRTGIRSIKVSGGRMVLNGKFLDFRGFGVHEDSQTKGFAIDNSDRERQIQWAREAGATLIRSHYPLHPYWYERMDELGLLAWTEVPVYAVKTRYLKQRLVRQLAARELESAIRTNWNHPSVIVWSIGNELSARPGPVQGYYIQRAARSAKALDPTRPVGYAVAGYPSAGCQSEYAPLDIIGINEYFGWYPGPNGQIADRSLLSDYLDSVRKCYPDKAIVITEFGAEANRDGPVEEKGTYAFQQDFINYHLGVYATKPWLSGANYWTLQEFYVRPGWEGGNPDPLSPLHQKAVITIDGVKKPAFADIQRLYTATPQYPAP
jgi:beta-glucuronidase